MMAEIHNVYECPLDDLCHRTQAERRAVRLNNGREDTTFANPGIDYDIRDQDGYEQPLGLSHDAERTRRIRQNDLYERSGDERRTRAANAKITRGIRELSAMSTTSGRNSNTILSNCCVMVCMIILLLASMAPAGYIYYDYEIRNGHSCVSNTKSSTVYQTRSNQNLTMERELRELSNQMHTLQNELKELKSASRQPQPGSGSSRQDRRLFAQLTGKANGIEKEIKDITKNLNDKILNLDKHYNDSITQLNSQLSNMNELLKHNRSTLGKCVQKQKSFTSDQKQNQTVLIVQSDDFTLTTVTCCTEFKANFKYYNAFLTAVERNNKTIYTCHCFYGQKCNICYWECSS